MIPGYSTGTDNGHASDADSEADALITESLLGVPRILLTSGESDFDVAVSPRLSGLNAPVGESPYGALEVYLVRNIDEPELLQVILHEVSPRSGAEEPVLSDLTLDLASQPDEVDSFLKSHISKTLGDAKAIAANFKGQDLDVAQQAARLLTENGFVEASQFLSARLFGIAANDRRIPDGTIVFVQYHAGGDSDRAGAGDAPFAGILKLDPSSQFQSAAETDAQGRRRVIFERVDAVLPSVRERLQKSAFLRPHRADDDYQALVLDRQTSDVADWFLTRFLEAEPALDPRERVDRFYRIVSQVQGSLRRAGHDDAARDLLQARDQSLRDRSIDVDRFVENRTELDAEQRRELREAIAAELPDNEFEVDRDRADSFLRKAKYRGDHGLYVSVNQDSRDEMMDVQYSQETETYTVTITTKEWEERP